VSKKAFIAMILAEILVAALGGLLMADPDVVMKLLRIK
jgi:hypothetical protein